MPAMEISFAHVTTHGAALGHLGFSIAAPAAQTLAWYIAQPACRIFYLASSTGYAPGEQEHSPHRTKVIRAVIPVTYESRWMHTLAKPLHRHYPLPSQGDLDLPNGPPRPYHATGYKAYSQPIFYLPPGPPLSLCHRHLLLPHFHVIPYTSSPR